jgi:hypothetical protein
VCLDWLYYKISKHIPSPINIKYSILLKTQARDGASIHLLQFFVKEVVGDGVGLEVGMKVSNI